jgi:hypothetical protein
MEVLLLSHQQPEKLWEQGDERGISEYKWSTHGTPRDCIQLDNMADITTKTLSSSICISQRRTLTAVELLTASSIRPTRIYPLNIKLNVCLSLALYCKPSLRSMLKPHPHRSSSILFIKYISDQTCIVFHKPMTTNLVVTALHLTHGIGLLSGDTGGISASDCPRPP